MIKLFIPYITNEKATELEQAAGFPPYTRGYSCLNTNTQLSDHHVDSDFNIDNYSDKTIVDLFIKIISLKIKGKIKLSFPLKGDAKEILYMKTIRSILSIISNGIYKTPKAVCFEFYGHPQNSKNELNTLILAKAAQIDYLIIDNLENWQLLESLCPKAPVDSLYGSKYLETEIEHIFFRLWPQIEKSLT